MADTPAVSLKARWFAVEQLDEVTVLRFIRPDMSEVEAADAISGPMFRQVDDLGRCRFVLDFAPVERVSSAVLGKLISFHRKVSKAGGRLALSSLQPDLYHQFERTKLTTIFRICPTEQEALEGVRGPSAAPSGDPPSAGAGLGQDTPLPRALGQPRL